MSEVSPPQISADKKSEVRSQRSEVKGQRGKSRGLRIKDKEAKGIEQRAGLRDRVSRVALRVLISN